MRGPTNESRLAQRFETNSMPRPRSLQPSRMWSSNEGTSTDKEMLGVTSAQPPSTRNMRRGIICTIGLSNLSAMREILLLLFVSFQSNRRRGVSPQISTRSYRFLVNQASLKGKGINRKADHFGIVA